MLNPTAEVLERKRRELEEEIIVFKNQKEDEYRAFQRQYIRDACGSVGIGDGCRDDLEQEQSDRLAAGEASLHSEGLGLSEAENRTSPGDGEHRRRSRRCDTEIRHTSAPQHGSKELHGPHGSHRISFGKAPVHERELEFQGLFIPSFLPLLESNGRKGSALLNEDDYSAECQKRISLRDESVPKSGTEKQRISGISSPASFPDAHHPSSISSSFARPLSASVPRQPPHQRRSSSRSDTSIASLRSSLRDPNQPRSPKRVLFSLGDKVVSPSTSPFMQRVSASQNSLRSELASANSTTAPGAVENQSNTWNMFPWSKNTANNASSAAVAPSGSDTTSFFARLNGGDDNSLLAGGDDFERVDAHDELFAFDEDVTVGKLAVDEDAKSEIQIESDEDDGEGEALPASSPHAGSLPIEIKWPTKFMPNG